MATQTKDISTTPQASSLQSSDNLIVTTGGGIKRLPMSALETAMAADLNNPVLQMALDGVFIMYHRKSDNNPLLIRPHQWPSLQASGEIADGVAILGCEKHIVVAPTEAPTKLTWSSAAVSAGGFTTTDRLDAMADFAGRENTTAQMTHQECIGENYAVGFCGAYARTNANGQGLTAGKWWLPSMGEMLIIYSNRAKINFALSLIDGATQLQTVSDAYWTSTEHTQTIAWYCGFEDAFVGNYLKASARHRVRPVSAFIK